MSIKKPYQITLVVIFLIEENNHGTILKSSLGCVEFCSSCLLKIKAKISRLIFSYGFNDIRNSKLLIVARQKVSQ